MGHIINYLHIPATRKDAEKYAMSVIHEDASHGDGYYGPMHWHNDTIYENEDVAMSAIERMDTGNYSDHAVKYYDYSEIPPNKKVQEMEQKLKELQQKTVAYEKAHSVKNFKAAFIGCPSCQSKLNREKLTGDRCPLCHADLRSKTTLDTLQRHRTKQKELETRIKREHAKGNRGNAKVMWLVKYEYHS